MISTANRLPIFKLLLRWRGSIWKAVMQELVGWLILFSIVSCIYRFFLSIEQQKTFNRVALFCEERMEYMPLSFLLGFFVTAVINRWIVFLNNVGIIDNVSLIVSSHVEGDSERARIYRRTIVRYCILAQTLVYREISMQVRKRFPTLDTVVAAGFMTKREREAIERVHAEQKGSYAIHWVPFQWAMALAQKAFKDGHITSQHSLVAVVEEIKQYRMKMATLCDLDRVPLPLVYPQLVYLATHLFFLVSIVSRQYIINPEESGSQVDLIIPFMAIIEFVVFYSWMNVALSLMNPMGEDDDDFESNWLLDRNLTIGLTMADKGYGSVPDLEKDAFFGGDIKPIYSAESRRVCDLRNEIEFRVPAGTNSVRMVSINENGKEEDETVVLVSAEEMENSHPNSHPFATNLRQRSLTLDMEKGLGLRGGLGPLNNNHGIHNFNVKTNVKEPKLDEIRKDEKENAAVVLPRDFESDKTEKFSEERK